MQRQQVPSLDLGASILLSLGLSEASSEILEYQDKRKHSLGHNEPVLFVFQDVKDRHFSPSADKNNSSLILKSLSFVPHSPMPYNGTLCESLPSG